jgi:hypothetical protein
MDRDVLSSPLLHARMLVYLAERFVDVSLYGTQGAIAPLQRLLNAAAEDHRDLEMRARERQRGILEEAWPQKLRRRTT